MNRCNFLKKLSTLLGILATLDVVHPIGGMIPPQGIEWVFVSGSKVIFGVPSSSDAYTGAGYPTLAEAYYELRRNQR